MKKSSILKKLSNKRHLEFWGKIRKKVCGLWGVLSLYVIAVTLLFFPYLKNTLMAYGISQTHIIIEEKLPSALPETEEIHGPSLTDFFASHGENVVGIGRLVIPTLAMDLPVTAGVTNEHLTISCASLYPERKLSQDNMVIMGHNLGKNDLFFGKLLDITKGSLIYLKYLKEMAVYQVTDTYVVKDTTLSPLVNTSDGRLTLVTCTTSYLTEERFIVIAKPVTEGTEISGNLEKNLLEKKVKVKVANFRSTKLTVLYGFVILGGCLLLRYCYQVNGENER